MVQPSALRAGAVPDRNGAQQFPGLRRLPHSRVELKPGGRSHDEHANEIKSWSEKGGVENVIAGKMGRGLIGNVFDLVLSRNICTNIVGIIYSHPLSQCPRINLRLEPPVEVILAC